jgi:uncharacterized protein with GYD domain
MPTYMLQAAYANEAWAKLVQRPENRAEALKVVIERLGGKMLSWYYALGDYDVVVMMELPSDIAAAAASMAVAAGKAVKAIKTTQLLSPEEGFDALLLAQGAGYQPPGGQS